MGGEIFERLKRTCVETEEENGRERRERKIEIKGSEICLKIMLTSTKKNNNYSQQSF